MINLNSNKKEILDKGLKVFSIRVFGYGFGFLFTWFLANKFGAKIQGIFSIAFLFLSVGGMIAKLGVETALVKWIASSIIMEQKKFIYLKSIQLIFISSVIVGTVIFLLAPLISYMYGKPDVENSVRVAAIAIPFLSILDISGSFFKGEKQTNTFGLYFHLAKFLVPSLIIIIFYYFTYRRNDAPILAYLIGLLVVSSIILSHILILFQKKVKEIKTEFTFKYMISESYPMMISSAIVMIMGWSDVFILGFYVSEEKIGVYSTAIKLATLVSFIYNAIATIVAPKIATFFHHNEMEQLKETTAFSAKAMFLFGIPVFLIIFIFPEFILSFFGTEYILGKNVLRILITGQLMNVLTGSVGPIMQMTGKQKKKYSDIHSLLSRVSLHFHIISSLEYLLIQFIPT